MNVVQHVHPDMGGDGFRGDLHRYVADQQQQYFNKYGMRGKPFCSNKEACLVCKGRNAETSCTDPFGYTCKARQQGAGERGCHRTVEGKGSSQTIILYNDIVQDRER